MSTTVFITDRTQAPYRLETAPSPRGSGWEPDTFNIENTSVSPGIKNPVVEMNRDEGIKDDKTYYMETQVVDGGGNPICSLWERVVGTWDGSDIWAQVVAADGHTSTPWLSGGGKLNFKGSDNKKYSVQVEWIGTGGFDDLCYILSGGTE